MILLWFLSLCYNTQVKKNKDWLLLYSDIIDGEFTRINYDEKNWDWLLLYSHDIIDGEFTRINYDEKNDYSLSVQTVRVWHTHVCVVFSKLSQ